MGDKSLDGAERGSINLREAGIIFLAAAVESHFRKFDEAFGRGNAEEAHTHLERAFQLGDAIFRRSPKFIKRESEF